MQKKTNYIWFNDNIIPWKTAKIHVMSHSLHYGTSIFEGIRFYDSYIGPVIFRHREHMQRLHNSAKIYKIPIEYNVNTLMKSSYKIIQKNQLTSGYIRPLVFIPEVGMGVNPPKNYKTDVIIASFPWKTYLGEEALKNGIDVMISSWNRLAPNTIPTQAKAGGNYLSSFLIGSEARRYGYHEGIALDINGYISEGAGENIFVIKDEVISTPPLSSSTLPGITRDSIIKLAKTLNIEIYEKIIPRESLYLADEIFITGTAAEITPVRSVDGIKIGINNCGTITQAIQKKFFGLFDGSTKDTWNWLDPIQYK